jgi:hypothetical protein
METLFSGHFWQINGAERFMILAIFNADPMNSDDPITIMVNRFKADQK